MQLHPHFLFNTLHAVSMLVRKGAHAEAVRMLSISPNRSNIGRSCIS